MKKLLLKQKKNGKIIRQVKILVMNKKKIISTMGQSTEKSMVFKQITVIGIKILIWKY